MTATLTPAPVLPSHAHSREIADGSDAGTRCRVAGSNCHAQAGFNGAACVRMRESRLRCGLRHAVPRARGRRDRERAARVRQAPPAVAVPERLAAARAARRSSRWVASAADSRIACPRSEKIRDVSTARVACRANKASNSMSSTPSPPPPLTVEHLDNAEGLTIALQRHGHDRVGHVAGALGDIRGEAGILADVVDRDRLSGHERPARDPAICGDTQADGRLGATPSGDTELEFLLALVEERDRARRRVEDEARGFDDCLQKLLVAAGTEHRAEVGRELCQICQQVPRRSRSPMVFRHSTIRRRRRPARL